MGFGVFGMFWALFLVPESPHLRVSFLTPESALGAFLSRARAGAKSSTDGPLRAELSCEAVILCRIELLLCILSLGCPFSCDRSCCIAFERCASGPCSCKVRSIPIHKLELDRERERPVRAASSYFLLKGTYICIHVHTYSVHIHPPTHTHVLL